MIYNGDSAPFPTGLSGNKLGRPPPAAVNIAKFGDYRLTPSTGALFASVHYTQTECSLMNCTGVSSFRSFTLHSKC